MLKKALMIAASFLVLNTSPLLSHCQMPCGIYHDQMVYDKVDEYFETMFKCCNYMNDSKFTTIAERNQFIRWVMTKDQLSDEIAHLLCSYFLQQKIKPADPDTADQVTSIHALLFLLVQIKQTVDVKIVNQFGDEWEHFKSLFHPEMICRPPTLKEMKLVNKPNLHDDHDQDHDHDHDHHDHDHDHDESVPHTH